MQDKTRTHGLPSGSWTICSVYDGMLILQLYARFNWLNQNKVSSYKDEHSLELIHNGCHSENDLV